jgi:uncharacterized membrane protein YfcA
VLIAVVAGGLLGITLGTVGGGGAVLAVPVLVYLLGQTVHAATTSSLIIVVGAAGVAAVGHARRGAVCWMLAAAFAAAAVPGGIAGTAVNRAVAGGRLLGAFAVLLVAVAVLTWRQSRVAADTAEACPDVRWEVVVLAGLGVGVLTGLFGVGGGFAVVPALALGLRVPFRRAIATSLVVVTAVSAVGLVEHLAAGADVEWGTALPFAGAAMVTASFGGRVAAHLPRRTLARGFAALLVGVAVYLLVSVAVLGGPPHG